MQLHNCIVMLVKVSNERKDNLMSQHVEVGLVFKVMLGKQDAADYMLGTGVPVEVVERVLGDHGARRESPIDEIQKSKALHDDAAKAAKIAE